MEHVGASSGPWSIGWKQTDAGGSMRTERVRANGEPWSIGWKQVDQSGAR